MVLAIGCLQTPLSLSPFQNREPWITYKYKIPNRPMNLVSLRPHFVSRSGEPRRHHPHQFRTIVIRLKSSYTRPQRTSSSTPSCPKIIEAHIEIPFDYLLVHGFANQIFIPLDPNIIFSNYTQKLHHHLPSAYTRYYQLFFWAIEYS